MAIDTENKRRNVAGIEFSWMEIGLLPTGGIDTDDRENYVGAYIGFDYFPPPAPGISVTPTMSELRQAIQTFTAGCLPAGWIAIFERQNAPRPSNQATPTKYVSIFMSAMLKPNMRDFVGPIQIVSPTVFATELVGDREFTITFQAYGVGAIQILEDIRTCLDTESVLDALRVDSIAVVQALGITDLTGLYDSQFLERGLLEVRFRTHARILDQLANYIERVTGEETYQHPPEPDIEKTFDIDSTP